MFVDDLWPHLALAIGPYLIALVLGVLLVRRFR